VWKEVTSVLTNPDYLVELARAYLTDNAHRASTQADERREIQVRLTQLDRQETRIVRDLADQDKLDLLDRTLAEIANEQQALELRLDKIDQAETTAHISEDRLLVLADRAKVRLEDPTPELMAEVFDLLDIQLHRVATDRFEGTGTIPIPEDGDLLQLESGGEVSTKGPLRPFANLTGSEFRIPVPIWVVLPRGR
jgi:hypothetical protein